MTDDGARAIRLLLATRFVRSIAQGALAVDFALYQRALDWSAVAISALLKRQLGGPVGCIVRPHSRNVRGGERGSNLTRPRCQPVLSMIEPYSRDSVCSS
jgi:hypothetical protein